MHTLHAGKTQQMVARLLGISEGRMYDIFRKWVQLLDETRKEIFLRLTQSNIIWTYPIHFIKADGRARCSLLLDAFEVFTQQSSNNNVASSTHSDYKKYCTVKFLGSCDNIGCTWDGTIPSRNPGRIYDVSVTRYTKILSQVPFGFTCKVDKGFIIDNDASAKGVVVDHPQKRLKAKTANICGHVSNTKD